MPGLPPNHELFARAALPAYGWAEDAELRLLSLSENATYLATGGNPAGGDPLVLRVHRPGYHSLAAIHSELAWMKALRSETAVATPELVAAIDGTDVVAADVDGEVLHVDLQRPRSRVELAEDAQYQSYRKAVIDFLYTRQGHVEKAA